MAVLMHHPGGRGTHPRAATILKALLTLLLVTAVVAAGAAVAAYAVSKVVVSLLT